MTSESSASRGIPDIGSRLERLPLSWMHYKLLILHGFGWLFDAMDVGIITFVVAVLAREWKLNPGQIGLIGSSGLAGMFVGAALAGAVADRWGRKAVFQVTLLIFAIATLLCSFARSFESMFVFRFFVGIGLGGELPVVSSLLSEFVPGKYRGKFIVLLESFWAVGWLAAALIAFLLIPRYGWPVAFWIGAVPALYIWVVRRSLPESPRWLESVGRISDAIKVVESLEAESARVSGKTTLVASEERIFVPEIQRGLALSELWNQHFRRRTAMLWILWFGLVFGYYGIFIWLPSLLVRAGYSMVNSFKYVVIITLAQIPGYFSAAFLVDRLGRKPVISLYLVFSALSAFLFGQSTSTAGILLWASVMSFFNLGAWGAVYTYTPELYPTAIRATGAGSATAFGRLAGVIAPFVVGLLLPSLGRSGILTLNACLFALAAAAVATLGVETKGKALEMIDG